MKRKTWFTLHSWCGLHLSVLMSFVCLTGTLATVSFEIDWLAAPEYRVYSLEAATLDWGALYANATEHSPDATVLSITAPPSPWFAATAVAVSGEGDRFRLFLNPHTSEVQGAGRWYNWQRFFRQVHRHLMLPVKVGVTIVSLLAFPMLIALYSGTVVYRRWWRGFFRNPFLKVRVRPDEKTTVKSRRRFWGNVHRWLGIWSIWFLLIIALTGLWYLLEQWGMQHRYVPLPKSENIEQVERVPLSANRVALFVERAKRMQNSFQVDSLRLPTEHSRIVYVQGQSEALLVRSRANQVAFNSDNDDLVLGRTGTELSAHARISEAADPLHFGTFGGTVTRYIWFFFGMAITTLSISGVYLYGLRVIRVQGESATSSVYKSSWRGMNLLKWAGIAAVFVSLILSIELFVL